jgi:phosphatidate phosphatase PAH1
MNGLKIDKIKFSKDIYIIADNFMAGFKNANNSVEIDLSNILIINKNAFSGVVLEVSIGSYSGVIYNDISSGIVYNDIYSRIIYNNID